MILCGNILCNLFQEFVGLLPEIFATVIGGLILALFLFFLNEYIFRKANLTGEWKVLLSINKTTYRPFEKLKIEYKIHLLQKGTGLTGSGEKIKDIKPDDTEYIFPAEKRVQLDVDGHFEKKYLRRCIIHLQTNEEGHIRETRATFSLKLDNKNKMTGTFISTAANASGSVEMTRS